MQSAKTITHIAVIGTGTIGASWTALFLAHGYDVTAFDPAPAAEGRLRTLLDRALADARPAHRVAADDGRLMIVQSLGAAVTSADLIQENGPERADTKAELIAAIEAAAPAHAIIASSTTAFPQSAIAAHAKDPERVIVAHPFNPPHLVPLVEIVGARPDAPAVIAAEAFYRTLGREPVILKREAVGHLANRLQGAVLREAIHCVEQGIATAADVDRAMRYGPGLRWAFMGPFETYHLAGGPGGIRQYFHHLGPSQAARWESLGAPRLTPELIERIAGEVEAEFTGSDSKAREAERDDALKALRAALQNIGRG